MIYVILGMHKSGTTLVSQTLHHSGINMVDELDAGVSYDQGNKYERESIKSLNEEILNCSGVESIDIAAPAVLQLTEVQRTRMKEIIRSCSEKYSTWGFKDPRTTLVYPLWASELPEHKIIVVYRSPNELWRRYRSDHRRNRYRDPYKAWKLMNRWCEHNARILTYIQNTQKNFIVLEYHKLVSTQSEFNRLQDFVGQDLSDRRRIDLYRHQRGEKPFLLRMMDRLIDQRHGYHSDQIMQQLETLKEIDQQSRIEVEPGVPQTIDTH